MFRPRLMHSWTVCHERKRKNCYLELFTSQCVWKSSLLTRWQPAWLLKCTRLSWIYANKARKYSEEFMANISHRPHGPICLVWTRYCSGGEEKKKTWSEENVLFFLLAYVATESVLNTSNQPPGFVCCAPEIQSGCRHLFVPFSLCGVTSFTW